MGIQVLGHTSFIGPSGYAAHSKNFFTTLNNYIPVRVRNYSYYPMTEFEKKHSHLLLEQDWQDPPYKIGTPFNPPKDDIVVNLILNESHHFYYYDKYYAPIIGYNVWESTRQLSQFFNRIMEFDQFWCPTEIQKQWTIDQGYPENKIRVVPEAVDGNIFYPKSNVEERKKLFKKYNIPASAFVFTIFGRWDYRKSTEEMVRAWVNKFKNRKKCYLVISVDNPFSVDGMKTTEERLAHYGLEHDRIRILHFPPQDEYIKWLQYGHCMISCSRSEGWNLPAQESLACGTPTILSNWGGHLEFGSESILVNVPKELPPKNVFMFNDEQSKVLGVWGEPDFNHLEDVMLKTYKNYDSEKTKALKLSEQIREKYTWKNAAEKADKYIRELVSKKYYYICDKNEYVPTVSFVTSFYNNGKYINELYDSINSQTMPYWEWIVTDDFSADNTKDLVLDIVKKDNRIKYIDQTSKQEIYWNPHKYASGKYILTIDADDKIVPKTAEVISKFFNDNEDVSCIHTNANYYKDNFKQENFKNSSYCVFDEKSILDKHPIYLKNESKEERVGYVFGTIRAYRNPGKDFNFNDGDFKLGKHEDLVKLIRMEELGKPFYLNRTLYKVRMHEDSNSGSWGDNNTEQEFDKIYDQANKRRKNCNVYSHLDKYNSISKYLNMFLDSKLNDELESKKISIFDFSTNSEQKKLIREIYYDHKISFNKADVDVDYIFVMLEHFENLKVLFDAVCTLENKNVLFYLDNKNWNSDYYKLQDGSKYFELFNKTYEFLKGRIGFAYTAYLFKYCTFTFTTPMKEKIKINLGCGNDIKPGYINVDRYNNTGAVDYQWDLGKIEMPDDSVDEIYTSHVFEHIPLSDVYPVLEEWERVLKIGGKLIIKLPDLETEVRNWLDAPDEEKWSKVHGIFGAQSHEGNTHYHGHTPNSLKWLIERFNFKVNYSKIGHSGYCPEIQLEAERIKSVKNTTSVNCNIHFVDGPFAEITGSGDDKAFYVIDFHDIDKQSTVHQHTTGINTWTRPHRKYFTNWLITIKRNGKLIHTHKFDLTDKNALVSFDTRSLGDSIAWLPQVEEFRKKYNCNVYLSTFWNKLFKDAYPDLNFVEPGSVVDNVYASYKIGCWENETNKNPIDWRLVPLQKVCADILGLEYKEIKSKIGVVPGDRPIPEKYVTLSEHSTFQCKYWNRQNGWQEVVDYLNSIGYKVMVISREETKLQNVIDMTNKPINQTITNIAHSEMFLGVSSGPSWLAWALNVPVIMVSGFSAPTAEFTIDCERVINTSVCHGCFNRIDNNFDRGQWQWCPFQGGTVKQFECTKEIAPEMVIERIDKLINKK